MRYPNFDKYQSKELFTPNDYLRYAKKQNKYPDIEIPASAIICFQNKLIEYVKEIGQAVDMKFLKADCFNLKMSETNVLVVGNFGIGAPIATIVVEELIAFGVKKFILVGTAGTLQKNISIGDIVICDKAIRDEGTSHHYLPYKKLVSASNVLTKNIISQSSKANIEYMVGTSWTIDTPYRETIDEIRKYQKENIASVEMEAAALFAVAQFRNVECSAIFTISDSLADLNWKQGFHHENVLIGLKKSFEIATKSFSDNC